jgi:hypothetical protein
MFKRFFGKKNDGFYMQIEDDAPTPKVPAKAKAEPAVEVPATPTATIAAPADVPTVVAAAPTAVVAATAAAPTAVAKSTLLNPVEKKVAEAEKAAAKAAAKAEKKSAKKAADEKKVAVAAVAAAPVAPAPAPPAPITNFATDYLIKPSSDSSRRRPGANMNKFLELAREAKIPVNIKK